MAQTFLLLSYSSDFKHSDMIVVAENAYKPEEDAQPVPLTQLELNNLAWNLNLSKDSTQLQGSPLKEKHLLTPGTTFYSYQDHERELRQFFMFQDKSSLVYCNNIAGLLKSIAYDVIEWRLFIDSSSRSLNAVLLYHGNSFSSIPIEHSVQMKETHNTMNHLLSAVNYQEHKWLICGDIKVVRLVLGLRNVSILVFCVSGTAGLMTNIISDKSGH